MRWILTIDPGFALSEERTAEVLAISGVKTRGRTFTVPHNARKVVGDLLTSWGVAYEMRPGSALSKWHVRDLKHAKPFLREWVPEFLTPYQRDGLKTTFLWPENSGMFVWSTGSGKTLGEIIWGLAGGTPVIVVTKVKYQYANEVRRFTTVEPVVLEGQTPTWAALSVGPEGASRPAPFVIVNYEILPFWIEKIEARYRVGPPISLVLDESQKASSKKRWDVTTRKEEGSDGADPLDNGTGAAPAAAPLVPPKVDFKLKDNVAAAVMRLSKLAVRRSAWTATPVQDRVRNLWAQLDLVQPYAWGPYSAWSRRYCGGVETPFGIDDRGFSNGAELKARLSTMRHTVTKSEANRHLPPVRRIVTTVSIRDQAKSGMITDVRNAAKRGQEALRETLFMEAAARKRPRVMEILDSDVAGKQKTIVFTGRRKDVEILLEASAKFRKRGALVLGGHGDNTGEEREAMRVEYMAHPGPAILIGTGDAWGEGLNLQDTDHLLNVMLPYRPGDIVQREGRVVRLGMTRKPLIEYLIAEGTIDERVMTLLLDKMPAIEKVIGQEEVSGFARDLAGLNDPDMMKNLAAKILGG